MAIPFYSYLITESLRHIEEETGEPCRDAEVEQQAIASGLTFGRRVQSRSMLLAQRLGLDRAVGLTTARISMIVTGFSFLCFVIGIGVTRALPDGYPARANVVSLLGILLLPNLISLFLWLVLTIYSVFRREPNTNGWLGRRALGLYTWLESVLNTDSNVRAAGRAWRDFLTTTVAGRHRLTMFSHIFWCAALTGALLGCWWLMVVRQVDFVWGSTLLTAGSVQSLLGNLTGWVGSFGFTVPGSEDIAASRIDMGGYDELLRRRWGIFILGAVLTLGILPRLAAMALDYIICITAGKKLEIDTAHSGYVRLQPVLMPLSYDHSIIDSDDTSGPVPDKPPEITTLSKNIPRGAAWLALEHAPEHPLATEDISADLGVVASYLDQQQVLKRLAGTSCEWESVCVYVDLATTPDRGIARLLTNLHETSKKPLHLVLGVSSRAAVMPDEDIRNRMGDWIQLAARAGIPTGNIHQS